MKAISVWQPSASWVVLKWKTIETRTHDKIKGLKGERIVIHASKKIDFNAFTNEYFLDRLKTPLEMENFYIYVGMNRGRIICTAKVVDTRWALNRYYIRQEWNTQAMCEVTGKYLLFLDEIKPIRNPIFFRGRQGIFNVPDEVLKTID